MVVLLELGLVLLLVGGIATFAVRGLRNRSAEEREAVTHRRVQAYIETIRRQSPNPELAAMSDTELADLLLSGARNLRVASERKMLTLTAVAAVALLAAIVVGTQDGTRGFGIALLVGAVAVYGLNEFLTRRIREPLIEKGLDPDRLRVE